MRIASASCLVLLAGCATAQAEPPRQQPAPVIRHIATSEGALTARAAAKKATVANEACQTNDPMPVAGRSSGVPAPMPGAPVLGAVPYIPNACPVTVPLARTAPVWIVQPGGKAVPVPPATP